MRRRLAGLVLAVPFALRVSTASAAPSDTTVFAFHDPAISEASALVVQDGLFLTTNDSGDSGRVFVVDDTGRTVGVTRWSSDPVDCEALAPAGPGEAWVGDIGDNLGTRPSVSIARIPVGHGDRNVQATTYRLVYPHGPADAETLVRNPVTGRLYIATKTLFGGGLYEVPARLSATATNRLRAVGDVVAGATDGSFFPDGRHLIVRNYTSAVVYTWPAMKTVATIRLPLQPQGEGISVAADGSVYVSSEGVGSTVLRVPLPTRVRQAVAATSPSASPSQDTGPGSPVPPSETDPASHDAWPWLAGGLLALVGLVVLVRALRPR
jgi:hypothetical protein